MCIKKGIVFLIHLKCRLNFLKINCKSFEINNFIYFLQNFLSAFGHSKKTIVKMH